jgi:MYXO-CTERM domain-containing protein
MTISRRHSTFLCGAVAALLTASAAHADVPAGYKGKPFDPVMANGSGIYPAGFSITSAPAAKAGPYSLPGRLDLINYDLGGELVAFHAGDHIAAKAGGGYRNDNTSASLGLTGWDTLTTLRKEVWYAASATLDGTVYPTPTTHEFYIGAIQVGDWFNYTVNVTTAGTYSLSSTWATGNGNGGEGGDGLMGIQVYSNGTKLGEWTDTFPNYQVLADYQHWKPYPNFLTITLEAGLQVIKIQSTHKHLHFDYIQFDLTAADGGVSPDAASTGTGGGAGSASGASGAAGTGGAGGTAGAAGTTGAAGNGTMSGAAGAGSGSMGGAGTTGAAGDGAAGGTGTGTAGAGGTTGAAGSAAGAGASGSSPKGASSSGCSCALGDSDGGGLASGAVLVVVGVLARARRRRRRSG